ncbi:hypothetical protein HDU93_002701, partial [Gonapodya sp. JEL0774]
IKTPTSAIQEASNIAASYPATLPRSSAEQKVKPITPANGSANGSAIANTDLKQNLSPTSPQTTLLNVATPAAAAPSKQVQPVVRRQQTASQPVSFPPATDCGCTDHYPHEVAKATFQMHPRALFMTIFGEEDAPGLGSAALVAQRQRGSEGLKAVRWERKPGTAENDISGWTKRELDYFVRAGIYPKAACHEEQTLVKVLDGRLYTVNTSVKTPKVPLGESFIVLCNLGDGKSQLLMTTKVHWIKRGLLSGQVEKFSFDGQQDFGKKLIAEILNQLPAASSTNAYQASLTASVSSQEVRQISFAGDLERSSAGVKKLKPVVETGASQSVPETRDTSWVGLLNSFLDWVNSLGSNTLSTSSPVENAVRSSSNHGISVLGLFSLVVVLLVACSISFTSFYWAAVTNANLDRTLLTLAIVGNNRAPAYPGAMRADWMAPSPAVSSTGVDKSSEQYRRAKMAELRSKAAELHLLLSNLEDEFRQLSDVLGDSGDLDKSSPK